MQFIAYFDKFGASYKPKLEQEQQNYKTVLGGIISLIIYIVSFVYFCYKFYQFNHNQMNPVQSFAFEYQENYTMNVQEPFLKIFLQGSQINPFNKTNQILVPSVFFQGDVENTQYNDYTKLYETGQVNLSSQILQPNNLSLANGNLDYPPIIMIALQICNSMIHQNCSDKETIDNFFNQNGLLIVTQIITKQYNSFTQKVEEIPQKVAFALERDVLFYQRTIMQAQILDVDQGILLPSYERHQFFSGYSIQTQSLGQSFFNSKLLDGVFIMELSMSQITERKVVQFIKISQVLADVGSIFSSLMLLSIIISSLNETLMEEEIISQVIGIYYPQFKKLQVTRYFLFGPIKQVRLKKQIINKEEFKKFYKKARKIALNKLSVYSSIYQISRLQFLIQGLVTRQEFKDIHQQGIGLNLIADRETLKQKQIQNQENDNNQESSQRKLQDSFHFKFSDEDFDILEYKHEKDESDQHKPLNSSSNDQIII